MQHQSNPKKTLACIRVRNDPCVQPFSKILKKNIWIQTSLEFQTLGFITRVLRCERGEDPAVGCHGVEAPVAVEHRRLPSSDCLHWHRKMQRSAAADEQNEPRGRCNDRARRCERGEDPAVGHHGAEAPVAVEQMSVSARRSTRRTRSRTPVVWLRTLALEARWRTVMGEQNHVS